MLFSTVPKKTVHKKQCPSPFPPPAAKTPRLGVAPLPAVRHRRSRPSPAPVPPLGIRALLARLLSRTPRARVRGGGGGPGTRTAAVQQELHSERQPAPAAVHRKNPLAGSPGPCARPLARPFLPHRPRAPQRPPQRAAPCTAHRSYKTSRDTHRTCAAAPTRPQRTRCSREGIDAQAAHGQVFGQGPRGDTFRKLDTAHVYSDRCWPGRPCAHARPLPNPWRPPECRDSRNRNGLPPALAPRRWAAS